MSANSPGEIRYLPASDQSLLVQIGDRITPEAGGLVAKVVQLLAQHPVDGIVDVNPAYCSLLVKFDGLRLDHATVETHLRLLLDYSRLVELPPHREIEIPVLYGGEFGPDLEDVAALHSISAADVVRLHSEAVYTVCFLGFVPGFAYLGGLPEGIATPRLPSPRKRVPAGSVAIGGSQAAVYPLPTPGGWRILGRTPFAMFRADRKEPSLLSIGDRVRFVPIDAARYAELERACR
jgi:KipI family sensor histidine kinase inhibitor